MVLKADQEVVIAEVRRHVVAETSGGDGANKLPRGRITEQRQRGERSSVSAGSDENAEACIRVKIEHENQVKRHSIRVCGRVVSRTDHKICNLPNRQDRVQRGTRT